MKHSPLSLAILSVLSSAYSTSALADGHAHPTKLDTIEVQTDTLKTNEQTETESTEQLLKFGNSETGAALRQMPGVDASRMGGHGLEVVIRGQQQSQLNILLDGAKIEAGCPNRMDPPTSYAELSSYDDVTVVKGVQSVQYGAGGSGGTVLFQRKQPEYDANKVVSGHLAASKSNVLNYDVNADLKAVAKQGYMIVEGAKKEGNNYQDGNGDTVGASYDTTQGRIDLGWTPSDKHHLKASYEQSNTADAVFPGALMDSPKSDGTLMRLQYEGRQLGKAIQDIKFNLYKTSVDHRMDNFSLRTPPMMMGMPMKRQNDTETEVFGSNVTLTSMMGDTKIDYGIQSEAITKNAVLKNAANGKSMFLMWPDAQTDKKSLFAETKTPFGQQNIIVGLRYDDITAEAKKANVASDMGTKASQLYGKAYSDYNANTDNKTTEGNLNGLIRVEGKLDTRFNWYAGLSHTKRTADETERYIAKGGNVPGTMPAVQNHWIGNPNLKPEKHNQLDLGIGQQTQNFNWQLSAWYDMVDDYILRDLATNQYNNGVKTSVNGKTNVYVNVNSELYGSDLTAAWMPMRGLEVSGALSYVRGKNTTDGRNLDGIAPVNGNIKTEYSSDNWGLGARFNFAMEQSDIDEKYTPTSAYGKTPAWSTIDLFADYDIGQMWSLQAGVDNLFDHAYYNGLNRGALGETYKVMEPGRNIWAKVSAEF